ncbi:beta-defensin 126-like [Mustela erminea]|uniref:beta-defensin 126-like n=1 Tax=Mustela erminea TaxID=36723 RepID=UPI00138680A7|nr:beta-defensin 126-like [Mustela erminea]
MKSLLFTLGSFILLAQLVSGSWYVRKCANRTGNCRSMCRVGETMIQPPTGMCPKEKLCCILSSQIACVVTSKTTTTTHTSESRMSTWDPCFIKSKGFILVSLFLLHPILPCLLVKMSGRASCFLSTSSARGGMQIR